MSKRKEKRLTEIEEKVFGAFVELPSVDRTMKVIEFLAGLAEDSGQDAKKLKGILMNIYEFSHMHTKTCQGVHMDFRHHFYATEKKLKEMGELE
ncbi:MAG: hypothetical protein WC208_08500 [Gallionella sp.]